VTAQSKQFKSYVSIYAGVWFCAVLLIFGVKLLGATQGQMGYLNMAFMGVSWLGIMGLNFYEGHRLMSYLQQQHPETWKWITTIPVFGARGINSFRTLGFLFSADDCNDPVVHWLKGNYKRFLAFVLLVFFSYVVIFTITVFIWK
jgi:hypothetical protein